MMSKTLGYSSSLNILHNYFDSLKLFPDLYLAEFLKTSTKPFFPCKIFLDVREHSEELIKTISYH